MNIALTEHTSECIRINKIRGYEQSWDKYSEYFQSLWYQRPLCQQINANNKCETDMMLLIYYNLNILTKFAYSYILSPKNNIF